MKMPYFSDSDIYPWYLDRSSESVSNVTPFITVSRTFWNISVSRHVLNEFWSDFCRLSAFSRQCHVSKEVFEDRWRPERFVIMFRNVKTRRTYHLHFYQATITFISSAITEGSAHTNVEDCKHHSGLSVLWGGLMVRYSTDVKSVDIIAIAPCCTHGCSK